MARANNDQADEGFLSRILGALWRQDDIEQDESRPGTGAVYFTSSADFALYPTCEGNRRFKTLLYYPIGLVVRDTGVRDSLDDRPLWLVESEYALLLLIPEDSLSPVEPDKTYVFANGLDFPVYCREPAGCVGDAGRSAAERGFNLHPKVRYGVSDAAPNGCEPLKVALFDAGAKQLRRADGQPSPQQYVLPCIAPSVSEAEAGSFETGTNGQVKVVTEASAKAIFDVPLQGDYHRLSNDLLATFAPGMTNVKPCGATLTTRTENEASAGLEVGGSYLIFSGKLGGTITQGAKLTQELGSDVFMQSSTYSLHRTRKRGGEDEQPILSTDGTAPIVAYLICDARLAPKELYMVRIYNENLGEVPLILLADELQGTAIGQASGEMGPLAGISRATPSARERGQAWKVKGYFEYFRLRDAFRAYVMDQSDLPEALMAADEATFKRHVDYFAHLLMAATTEPRTGGS